jgi:hypothetical protein
VSVAEVLERGVLKAPVDCSCSFSKISCSSLGRRGGPGCGVQADGVARVVENVRRKKPGRTARTVLAMGCMMLLLELKCSGSGCSRLSIVRKWDVNRGW